MQLAVQRLSNLDPLHIEALYLGVAPEDQRLLEVAAGNSESCLSVAVNPSSGNR